jgi:hypothetical protein
MPDPPQGLPVSADRIAAIPDSFVGRRVQLMADVARVESEGLVVLQGGLASTGDVLVLNPRSSSPPAVGARVTVSGTVVLYSSEALGRIGPLPPNAEVLEERYAGRPVVVADSIRMGDGRELVAASSGR